MPRMPRPRTRALILLVGLLFAAGLAVPSLWNAAGQVTLSEPLVLPGDAAPAPAAGRQEQPSVAQGAENSLVVWADARTVLDEDARVSPVSLDDPSSGPGLGTLFDVYAARLDAAGQVVDQTPVIVSQAEWGQVRPQVGWNGQNFLVTWTSKRPRDQFSHTLDLVAARVSPAGQLLDPEPIVLRGESGATPTRVISDAAGNFVVVWADFVPQPGTVGGEPRGVYVARVTNDGQPLDPSGRVVYTHTSQFLGEPDLARAGDLYLLTFVATGGGGDTAFALPLDADFNRLRPAPERIAPGAASRPRLASNGDTFFAVWGAGNGQNLSDALLGTRISRAGDPLDLTGINLATGSTVNAGPHVAWDGAAWVVTYSVSRFSHDDIHAARVAPNGAVLNTGLVLDAGAAHQTASFVAPGVGGGAQAVWHDAGSGHVNAARLSAAGVAAPEVAVSLGAPRQSEQRMASNGNGFLAVFRSEVSGSQRIMGQHLDASGAPVDQAPFVIAEGAATNNPSVAWDGQTYLAVWEVRSGSSRQIHGRLVPPTGAAFAPPFYVMDGETPDAAGLEGTFLVVGIHQQTAQIRTTRALRVSSAGTLLGAPVTLDSAFNFAPRAAAYGPRFLVVWERHNNHDDAPGNIYGAFVSPADGASAGNFLAGDAGDDRTPHLAVAGPHALLAWSHGDHVGRHGDVNTRRLNPDGTSPDPPAGSPLVAAPDVQARPAVAWDGSQYVVTWLDHRRDAFPRQPRGDVFAALVSHTNVRLEEFAVADSPLPEDTPFVASAGGLTVLSYSKFYPAPFAANRVTLRTGRFPAPALGAAPPAPSQLVAVQVNNGPATGHIRLAWSDNSANESGFRVESSTNGTAFTHLRELPAGATALEGVGVGTQQQNFFRVRAFNAGGDSGFSNVASPPQAALVEPATNSIYNHPAVVPVVATANDADGVARVEFYAALDPVNGGPAGATALVGTDTTPDAEGRYRLDWNAPAGYYHLTAKAFDAQGSSTTTFLASVLVRRAPTATVTAPAAGSVYTQPAHITLTGSAQTNNNRADEHIERLDFYAGNVWIGRGTNTAWQAPWSFTWENAPAGTHEITAQATSNWGQIGVSAPVRVVVNPETPPTPENNVRPVVTLTAPASGASHGAGATVTAAATASDPDGQIARVEFRANGFLVEADTTAPYGADLLLPGGAHTITAVAFDDRNASTVSAAAAVTVARDAGARLTSAQWDGQSEFGPSVVTHVGAPMNKELADDFDLVADIDRVVFNGSRGFGAADNPAVRGAYVRFYSWDNGNPGALQEEFFLPAGDPGLVYDARTANTFDLRLPRSFRATGKHFFSVQLLVEGTSGYWYWLSTRSNAPQNSTVKQRDHYAGGGWTASGNRDAVFSLYGTLTSGGPSASGARIDSLAPATAARSSHFVIHGASFGETQNGGRVLVDNHLAVVVRWTGGAIFAHVPEAARTGHVPVQVFTSAGASNTATLDVTARAPDQRLRWRVSAYGDALSAPVVAPAGSPDAGAVYASGDGYIYAWSPDGALKWVAGDGGTPVSVGADGTIYAATAGYDAQNRFGPGVLALNPDGSRKWMFVDPNSQTVRAGPNVGPDGKIYVVFRPLVDANQRPVGVNFAALRPDGTLAWSVNRHFWKNGQGLKKLVFGRTLPHVYFAYDVEPDPSPGFVNGGTFAYDFDGRLVWEQPGMCCGVPAVPPDEGVRHGDLRLDPLTGNVVYNFEQPSSAPAAEGAPEAGPDNTHYVKFGGNTVYAINPDGTEKWDFNAGDMVGNPAVNSTNTTLLLSGGGSFNRDSFFLAVDPASGSELWRMTLPRAPGFEPYGNYFLSPTASFSPAGETGYFTGDVNGDQGLPGFRYAYLYALNTTREDVPVNRPPRVSMTSPINGAQFARNTSVTIAADVADDGALSGVDFYVNAQLISTDTTAPYSVNYNPAGAADYSIRVVARDAGGLTGEATSFFRVVNEPPRVNWVSPTDGAFLPPGQGVTLTARAEDIDGSITRVEFNSSVSGLIGEDATPDAQGNYSVVFNNPAAGQHTLVAWATDADGVRLGADIDVTFGTAPAPTPTPGPPPPPSPTPSPTPNPNAPTVRISSPATGSSFLPGADVVLTAEAAAASGKTITRVDFVNAAFNETICADSNAPYNCTFTRPEPYLYDVVAVARDSAGLTARSAPVRVLFEEAQRVSISGRLRHQASQPGAEIFLANARVTLEMNDQPFREARTDAQGVYRFDNLSHGGQFTVRPAEPGYTFFPPAAIWHGIAEDKAQDFTAEGALPPQPTPTPTPGANVLAWQKFYDGPRGQSETDARLAVDAQGNSYVAGITRGAGESSNDTDIATVKYNAAGERLWARTFAGLGAYLDRPEDIAVDAQGNVYVTGASYRGAAFWYDFVTIKYDAAGNEQWVRYYNGPKGDTDWAHALDVDSQGNVYVTGYITSAEPGSGFFFYEYATVKYDAAGNEQWVRLHSTKKYLQGHIAEDVAVDSQGNAYVTGYAWLGASSGEAGKDIVTVKYNPAGDVVWSSRFNSGGASEAPDVPVGLALDPAGGVYVFGHNKAGETLEDFLLVKLDGVTGGLAWSRTWAAPFHDYARDIAVDSAGSVYLTGETYDADYYTATRHPTSDVATVKFDAAGNLLWERFYRAFPGMQDAGRRVALDSSGNAYVGASSEGFANADVAVVKYLPDGTEAWAFRYDNPSHTADLLDAMEADAAGNLYLAGSSVVVTNGARSRDLSTVKLAVTPSTVLNSPPEVSLQIGGPTIAGRLAPVSGDGAAGPSGPTIAGCSVTFNAAASDRDGTVARVDFYNGTTLVGSDTTAPYSVDFSVSKSGTYAINAMATDNGGATRASGTTAVTLNCGGAPAPAPAPPAYTVTGLVTAAGGHALGGVSVSLTGAQTASTTTGPDGRYTFDNVPAGSSCTVTPALPGYEFTPGSRTFDAVSANQTADFTAAAARVNYALAANGATATASSTLDSNRAALAAINGDRKGQNWGSNPATGSGWHDATSNAYPDWLEVSFGAARTIDEVNVFSVQDNVTAPAAPTEAMTFTKYGVTGFEVRYWDGSAWQAVPGASVAGNNKVWRKVTFAPLQTSKLRVVLTGALAGYSRLAEVEAWGAPNASAPPPAALVNHALAANGATATASSTLDANRAAAAAINGDRKGQNWGSNPTTGSGWHDATTNSYPDWLEVTFPAARTVSEVNVFSVQDAVTAPSEPTEAMAFTKYGVTGFQVEYWTGSAWSVVPGGLVASNNKVWARLTFPAVTTTKLRVVVNSAQAGYSRLAEFEAWGPTTPPPRVNVAAASNGATATASSTLDANRAPLAAINGDRKGQNWGSNPAAGSGWHDATSNAYPDWLEVTFSGAKTISEVSVFSVQDNVTAPAEPTEGMTFTKHGVTGFDVEYWDGASWQVVPGGMVVSNNKVWARVTFAPLQTTRIRVVVRGALAGYSRLTEVEVY